MDAILSFRDVHRSYGKTAALRGATLEVPEGCVLGLLGRNGAGKSTLLRMVPPLLRPDRGEVRVFGRDPWADEGIRRDLGYLSETDAFPRFLSVRDLLDLHARLFPRWDEAMSRRLLERFQIDTGELAHSLSKGQRRQVGLILAVSHHPRLLVLDEPAGGLDPIARRGVFEVIIESLASEGTTVVYSSHQLQDVERLATRVAILERGRFLVEGPLDELKEKNCRAEIRTSLSTAALEEKLPALRVTEAGDRVRVTLPCRAEEAESLLAERLGHDGRFEVLEVRGLSLEEYFIDSSGEGA